MKDKNKDKVRLKHILEAIADATFFMVGRTFQNLCDSCGVRFSYLTPNSPNNVFKHFYKQKPPFPVVSGFPTCH